MAENTPTTPAHPEHRAELATMLTGMEAPQAAALLDLVRLLKDMPAPAAQAVTPTKSSIPEHQRQNHEATDEVVDDLRGLVAAMDLAIDNVSGPTSGSTVWNAFHVLLRLVKQKVAELERCHAIEWAGLGGETRSLTAAEISSARGIEPAAA